MSITVNHVTYGHDVSPIREENLSGTRVRVSLLRAPRYPDPHADQGPHVFRHVLRLGADIGAAIDEGYRLHHPARRITGAHEVPPLARVDHEDVLVETVKLAEDHSGDLILRLYESRGGHAQATLHVDADVGDAAIVDLHEDPVRSLRLERVPTGVRAQLRLRPFQILTLRLAGRPPRGLEPHSGPAHAEATSPAGAPDGEASRLIPGG